MYVEVTSPGLDRVFKNATEFSVFSGKQVKVWDTDIKDWVQGTILSADSQAVTLSTGKGEITVPYARIAKAKLNNA
jgi:ribosome maturation factor RimP